MKNWNSAILLFLAMLGLAALLPVQGCFEESTENTPPPECTENSQCTDGKVCVNQACVACTSNDQCGDEEMCSGGQCITCHCMQMTGYCTTYDQTCSAHHFSWTGLGCPGGREGMCCLPDNSCTSIQGICTEVGTDCPAGYGGYFALDCPQGQNGQCCIPLN